MATAIFHGPGDSELADRARSDPPRGITLLHADSLDELLARIEASPGDVCAVVLAGGHDQTLHPAHRVRQADADLAVLILCPRPQLFDVRQMLILAPLLGRATHAHPRDADLRTLLGEAVEGTAKRRSYRRMVADSQARLDTSRGSRPLPGVVLDRLLEHAPVGVVLLDPPGTIAALNRRARELLSESPGLLPGTPFCEALPAVAGLEVSALVERALRGIVATGTFEVPGAHAALHLSATAAPVSDLPQQGCLVILEDVSERLRARAQIQAYAERLEAANAELSRSNEELEAYAQIVSHDLKAPLRGIRTLAAALIEDHGNEVGEDVRDHLETLGNLGVRMSGLIDRLLEFSRVGHVDMAIRDTDLDALLTEQLAVLQVDLDGLDVEVCRPAPLPRMCCDGARVGEVFQNLIGNAVQYHDGPGCRVEIGVVGGPGAPVPERGPDFPVGPIFYVRDNGIGIPGRHLEDVFGVFRRLHSRRAYGGGSGTGLAIAKRIVERHGGTIWAESTPGEGSVFYFTLGAAAPA